METAGNTLFQSGRKPFSNTGTCTRTETRHALSKETEHCKKSGVVTTRPGAGPHQHVDEHHQAVALAPQRSLLCCVLDFRLNVTCRGSALPGSWSLVNTSARGANTRTCKRHALSHEFIALHYDLLLSVGSDRGLCLQAVLVALLAGLDQVLRCTLINCMSKLRPTSQDQSLAKLSKGVLEERLMNVEFFPILAIAL